MANDPSQDKRCLICKELVLQKPKKSERKFGILIKCTHCFCVTCIRNWRKVAPGLDYKTIKSCPICKELSKFIIPSRRWVEALEDKLQVFLEFKTKANKKICMYYKWNKTCPVGSKCFFRHSMRSND